MLIKYIDQRGIIRGHWENTFKKEKQQHGLTVVECVQYVSNSAGEQSRALACSDSWKVLVTSHTCPCGAEGETTTSSSQQKEWKSDVFTDFLQAFALGSVM